MANQNNAAQQSSDSRLPFVFSTENDTGCLQLEEQVEWMVQILIWERKLERVRETEGEREKEGDIQTDARACDSGPI